MLRKKDRAAAGKRANEQRIKMKDKKATELARKKILKDMFSDVLEGEQADWINWTLDRADEFLALITEPATKKIDEWIAENKPGDDFDRTKTIHKDIRNVLRVSSSVFASYANIKTELLLGLCADCKQVACMLSPKYDPEQEKKLKQRHRKRNLSQLLDSGRLGKMFG